MGSLVLLNLVRQMCIIKFSPTFSIKALHVLHVNFYLYIYIYIYIYKFLRTKIKVWNLTLDLAHPACMAYLIKYDLSHPTCLVVAIFNSDFSYSHAMHEEPYTLYEYI